MRSAVPVCLAALFALLTALQIAKAAPVSPTDNAGAPYFGVYEWSPSSASFAPRVETLKSWLLRSTVWIEEFEARDSWANISGPNWMLNPARDYLNAHPGTKYILSVPMLPGDKLPLSGTSLSLGVTGTFNGYFKTLAQNLVNKTLNDGSTMADHTIIRLGWEFNGDWYPWQVGSQQDALNFAAYWRQIYTAMKAVNGTTNLKFCWNGATRWTSYNISDAYPGDAYVDYIGVDVYDASWSYYPPANSSTWPNAWTYDYAASYNNGLMAWKNFASSRGKPLAIPEWGTDEQPASEGSHGGLDNTLFIQRMYNFIQDPANNVAFHVYFDIVPSAKRNHQISPAGNYTTRFPNAAALFRQLFTAKTRGARADTYVRDGSFANSSFGTETAAWVKLDGTGFARESYLRFDVSGLQNVSSVKLLVTPTSLGADSASTTLVFQVLTDDSWNETGLNWNNRITSGNIVSTITGGFVTGQPVQVDLTTYAKTKAAGNGLLSLRVYSTTPGSQRYIVFGTRENATVSNRPTLQVTP